MVYKSTWNGFQQCVVTSSLALSCLCAASAQASSACPVYQFTTPNHSSTIRAAAVTLELQEALLQPQLEQFLKEHFAVAHIDWRVSAHFQWPTPYTLTAPTATAVLEQLLAPYALAVTFFPNHVAVVSYRQHQQVQS